MQSKPNLKTFFVVWSGQVVSLIGSGLTHFGLGIWVFRESGSATEFALIALAAMFPGIVLSPFAGVLVDRWDRRITMILADVVAMLGTIVIITLLWMDMLAMWHILLAACLGSVAGAFQSPAYQAATTLLVPKRHLGRAAGLIQLGDPLRLIVAPIIAGALMAQIELSGLILIDFSTFIIAMLTLAFVTFPKPEERPEEKHTSMLEQSKVGWRYIHDRKGLKLLLFYFTLVNFVFGFSGALYGPLVLSFADEKAFALVLSAAGIGGLIGGVLQSITGGPKNRILGIFGFGIFVGLGSLIVGLKASIPVIAIGGVTVMIFLPMINGCSQAFWQTKVPPEIQGRVFALRSMFAMAAIPAAYGLAGPLADKVFEPGMQEGGFLAPIFGDLIGVGDGRGIGLMFVMTGLAAVLLSVVPLFSRRVRNLDSIIPDVIEDPDEEPDSSL